MSTKPDLKPDEQKRRLSRENVYRRHVKKYLFPMTKKKIGASGHSDVNGVSSPEKDNNDTDLPDTDEGLWLDDVSNASDDVSQDQAVHQLVEKINLNDKPGRDKLNRSSIQRSGKFRRNIRQKSSYFDDDSSLQNESSATKDSMTFFQGNALPDAVDATGLISVKNRVRMFEHLKDPSFQSFIVNDETNEKNISCESGSNEPEPESPAPGKQSKKNKKRKQQTFGRRKVKPDLSSNKLYATVSSGYEKRKRSPLPGLKLLFQKSRVDDDAVTNASPTHNDVSAKTSARAKIWDSSESDEALAENEHNSAEPTDKVYHICKELLTTETAYVKRLKHLVKAKDVTSKVLGEEVAKQMFRDIEIIYQFHNENLLPRIKHRMLHWEDEKRIGDVMKQMAPFLKLYTNYIKGFEQSNQMYWSQKEKSTSFANAMQKLQASSKELSRLEVASFLIEPVQRVPRYELLLRDYLKTIKKFYENPPDQTDAAEAMKLVTAAASHFEEMMKHDSQMGKLYAIQRQLEGSNVNIVSSRRELKWEGKICSISHPGRVKEKYAYLFNDLLLICNQGKLMPVLYKQKVQAVLPTSDILKVMEAGNLDVGNTFVIVSPQRYLELGFASSEQTLSWLKLLNETIQQHNKNFTMILDDFIRDEEDIASLDNIEPEAFNVSNDEGDQWKRRWLKYSPGGRLYSFKEHNETEPISVINIQDFLVRRTKLKEKEGKAIVLEGHRKLYILHSENTEVINLWFEEFRSQFLDMSDLSDIENDDFMVTLNTRPEEDHQLTNHHSDEDHQLTNHHSDEEINGHGDSKEDFLS